MDKRNKLSLSSKKPPRKSSGGEKIEEGNDWEKNRKEHRLRDIVPKDPEQIGKPEKIDKELKRAEKTFEELSNKKPYSKSLGFLEFHEPRDSPKQRFQYSHLRNEPTFEKNKLVNNLHETSAELNTEPKKLLFQPFRPPIQKRPTEEKTQEVQEIKGSNASTQPATLDSAIKKAPAFHSDFNSANLYSDPKRPVKMDLQSSIKKNSHKDASRLERFETLRAQKREKLERARILEESKLKEIEKEEKAKHPELVKEDSQKLTVVEKKGKEKSVSEKTPSTATMVKGSLDESQPHKKLPSILSNQKKIREKSSASAVTDTTHQNKEKETKRVSLLIKPNEIRSPREEEEEKPEEPPPEKPKPLMTFKAIAFNLPKEIKDIASAEVKPSKDNFEELKISDSKELKPLQSKDPTSVETQATKRKVSREEISEPSNKLKPAPGFKRVKIVKAEKSNDSEKLVEPKKNESSSISVIGAGASAKKEKLEKREQLLVPVIDQAKELMSLKKKDALKKLQQLGIPKQKKLLETLLPNDYLCYDFGNMMRQYYSYVLRSYCVMNCQDRYRGAPPGSKCFTAIDLSTLDSKEDINTKVMLKKLEQIHESMEQLKAVSFDQAHFDYLKDLVFIQPLTIPLTIIRTICEEVLPSVEDVYTTYKKLFGAHHVHTKKAVYHYNKLRKRLNIYNYITGFTYLKPGSENEKNNHAYTDGLHSNETAMTLMLEEIFGME